MRYSLRLVFVFFLLVSTAMSQTRITVLHTNNINGTLENCRCIDQPLGSLEKIKWQVDKIRTSEKNVLFLDSGDFFSPFGDDAKSAYLLKAFKLMNYDAATPGDQAFAGSMSFFREKIIPARFPYVSLNLSVEDVKPFSPMKVVNLNGFKINIIGLSSEETYQFYAQENVEGLTIEDYSIRLAAFLNHFSNDADFIILISHLGYETDKQLAEEFPEIGLIIGGHSQNKLDEVEKIGQTLIAQAGSDGAYLGRVDLDFGADKKLAGYSGKLIPMTLDLPNDEAISKIAKEYDFLQIDQLVKSGKIPQPLVKDFDVIPSGDCKQCHAEAYTKWADGPHARSYATIDKEHKTSRAQCVACHVSGFGRSDGFININLTPQLGNVGCIDCHLTTKSHLKDKSSKSVQPITKEVCLSCHDQQNDPDFNFEAARKQVAH